MKNYFAILELTEDATEADIRKAYRALVKKYHPDTRSHHSSEQKFIQITEAYNYLSVPENRRRHAAYIKAPRYKSPSEQELRRKQAEYEDWVRREERMAYVRMRQKQKELEEEAFKKTLAYAIMQGVNKVYNVLFLCFAAAVVIIPMYKYYHQEDLPLDQQQSIIAFIIPSCLGLGFAIFGYYYFFILKTDEK